MPLFGFRKDKKQVKDYSQAAAPAQKTASTKMAKIQKSGKMPIVSSKSSKGLVTPKKSVAIIPSGSFSSTADAIIRPRITEKSGILSQSGVYTFEVTRNSNKAEIGSAIKSLYKVTPTKVAIVNLPTKSVFVKGRRGTVSGIRKALVTLRKGDKIDFV
ncbi:MAG: 50S ribosomal protein L23 [Patescibacteria group bacterium]